VNGASGDSFNLLRAPMTLKQGLGTLLLFAVTCAGMALSLAINSGLPF
jgi:hypothetical protein